MNIFIQSASRRRGARSTQRARARAKSGALRVCILFVRAESFRHPDGALGMVVDAIGALIGGTGRRRAHNHRCGQENGGGSVEVGAAVGDQRHDHLAVEAAAAAAAAAVTAAAYALEAGLGAVADHEVGVHRRGTKRLVARAVGSLVDARRQREPLDERI